MKYFYIGFFFLSIVIVINSLSSLVVNTFAGKAMEHEEVIEPTKELMKEIESRLNDMLTGILENNLKYVANEAGAVVDQSYKINQLFFDFNMKGNTWFKRAGIDPNDTAEVTKRKEEFTLYQSGIVYKALNVRKMAISGDQEGTLRAFTDMIESTCFDCHRKNRDWLLDQPGSHGPGR